MKLKCDLHERRVIAHEGKFIHRNGEGGVCPSKKATIGDEKYTAKQIQQSGIAKDPEEETPEEKLLKNIFAPELRDL